jgi:hypothetical protein
MTLASERAVVQNPLLRYATEAGWIYPLPKEPFHNCINLNKHNKTLNFSTPPCQFAHLCYNWLL